MPMAKFWMSGMFDATPVSSGDSYFIHHRRRRMMGWVIPILLAFKFIQENIWQL